MQTYYSGYNPNAGGGGGNGGGNNGSGGSGAGGNYDGYDGYGVPGEESRLYAWEATRLIHEGLLNSTGDLSRLMELAQGLGQYLEATRTEYNRLIAERDAEQRRLQDANAKLSYVQGVAARYIAVRDPVVASDGFTYEREQICKYLEDCSEGNSRAYSQQTKEELTSVMVENRSLQRLVSHLTDLRPVDVPTLTNRPPIAAMPAGGPRGISGGVWGDAERGMKGKNTPPSRSSMPVAALDAGLPTAVGGLNASTNNTTNSSGGAGAGPTTVGGIALPVPASASNRAGRSGTTSTSNSNAGNTNNNNANRGGAGAGAGAGAGVGADGARPALHPCLRVYGFCNFMDDCTFANYPYEACLNHIKGKCRFGQNCKELHVDPREPRYQNTPRYAHLHNHNSHNKSAAESEAKDSAAAAAATPEKAEETSAHATGTTATTTANAVAAAAVAEEESKKMRKTANEADKAAEAEAESGERESAAEE